MPPPIVSTSAFVKTVNGRSPVSGAVVVTAGDVGLGTGDSPTFANLTVGSSSPLSFSSGSISSDWTLLLRSNHGWPIRLNATGQDNLVITSDGRTIIGPTPPTDTSETLIVGGDARVNGDIVLPSFSQVRSTGGSHFALDFAGTSYFSAAGNLELQTDGTSTRLQIKTNGEIVALNTIQLADINTSTTAGTAAGQIVYDSIKGHGQIWHHSDWHQLD